MAYMAGTRNRVTKKANPTPNARDITTGFRNAACMERSSIIGIRPTMVVTVVSRIGRKRSTPALTTARYGSLPWLTNRLQ